MEAVDNKTVHWQKKIPIKNTEEICPLCFFIGVYVYIRGKTPVLLEKKPHDAIVTDWRA